jgi:hypothetical protein
MYLVTGATGIPDLLLRRDSSLEGRRFEWWDEAPNV